MEDPRQGIDGGPQGSRWIPHLLPLRYRQLSPDNGANLHGPELLHRQPEDRARCRAVVQLHHRLCDPGGTELARDIAAQPAREDMRGDRPGDRLRGGRRSEEHTSELQSLMRISYAVFCLKKKNPTTKHAS